MQRAPERVIAAVPAMPSGFRPEVPDLFYRNSMKNWAPALCEKRPDVTMERCSAFLEKMYYENNDFVFSVTRDSVRGCTTPVLVMPDDTEPHPMPWQRKLQCWRPNAQMTFFPWKQAKDRVPLDRGARRSKVGRRSLCSQDANDRFWHDAEVFGVAAFPSGIGGSTDVRRTWSRGP